MSWNTLLYVRLGLPNLKHSFRCPERTLFSSTAEQGKTCQQTLGLTPEQPASGVFKQRSGKEHNNFACGLLSEGLWDCGNRRSRFQCGISQNISCALLSGAPNPLVVRYLYTHILRARSHFEKFPFHLASRLRALSIKDLVFLGGSQTLSFADSGAWAKFKTPAILFMRSACSYEASKCLCPWSESTKVGVESNISRTLFSEAHPKTLPRSGQASHSQHPVTSWIIL